MGGVPEISVVMPMRDAQDTVEAQLAALSGQTFAGTWELIVADNGSHDASCELVLRWRDRIPGLQVVDAAAAHGSYGARNLAAHSARAPRLAFCDADDVVGSSWLQAIAEGLERWPLVTGPLDLGSLNAGAVVGWRGATWWPRLPGWHRFLPGALTSNLGLRREVFDALGGFTIAPSGSDLRFVWRAQLSGYALGGTAGAAVARREPSTWTQYVRRGARYGMAEPQLYKEFRADGMPRSSVIKAASRWLAIAFGWPALALPAWRYAWLDVASHRVGRLVGSVRAGVLYL